MKALSASVMLLYCFWSKPCRGLDAVPLRPALRFRSLLGGEVLRVDLLEELEGEPFEVPSCELGASSEQLSSARLPICKFVVSELNRFNQNLMNLCFAKNEFNLYQIDLALRNIVDHGFVPWICSCRHCA